MGRPHSPAQLPLQGSEAEVKATHAEDIKTPGAGGGGPPRGGQAAGRRHDHQAAAGKVKLWLTGVFHLRSLPSCRPPKTPVKPIALVPQTLKKGSKKLLA